MDTQAERSMCRSPPLGSQSLGGSWRQMGDLPRRHSIQVTGMPAQREPSGRGSARSIPEISPHGLLHPPSAQHSGRRHPLRQDAASSRTRDPDAPRGRVGEGHVHPPGSPRDPSFPVISRLSRVSHVDSRQPGSMPNSGFPCRSGRSCTCL